MQKNIIVIGSFAALSTAIYKSMDNFTIHNLIITPDNLTSVFAYLIIGSWTGTIASIFFSLLFGKKLIDKEFVRIVVKNPRMHLYAFISGSISSSSTLFLLMGNQLGDPSILIALANLTVVYTLLFDVWKGQTKLSQILIPTIFTIIGGMLASFGGSLSITGLGFFYIVILSNGLDATSQISEQNGIRCSDSVSFLIWRFFWLALSGTIIAIVISSIRGYLPLLFKTLSLSMIYLPWIVATMLFVFLGMGLKFYLKKTQSVSIVLLIMSVQIFISYPITIIGNILKPNIFGLVPDDPKIWMIRIIGSLLIITGIVKLKKSFA